MKLKREKSGFIGILNYKAEDGGLYSVEKTRGTYNNQQLFVIRKLEKSGWIFCGHSTGSNYKNALIEYIEDGCFEHDREY